MYTIRLGFSFQSWHILPNTHADHISPCPPFFSKGFLNQRDDQISSAFHLSIFKKQGITQKLLVKQSPAEACAGYLSEKAFLVPFYISRLTNSEYCLSDRIGPAHPSGH